jgi:hypothetical protein
MSFLHRIPSIRSVNHFLTTLSTLLSLSLHPFFGCQIDGLQRKDGNHIVACFLECLSIFLYTAKEDFSNLHILK